MNEQVGMIPQAVRFKAATRRNRIPLQDLAFTGSGQTVRADLPQVGLVHYLDIYVFGTLTSGSGSVGTFDAHYWPYNLLSNVRVRSNEGLEIANFGAGGVRGAFSNLLMQMAEHMSHCPAQLTPPTAFDDGTTAAKTIGFYPTGALATTTAYKVGVMYRVPFTVDDNLSAGLLLLQNQATRCQVELTTGQATDWAGANGLGTSPTISLTAKIDMKFFSVPEDPSAFPDMSFVYRNIEEQDPWTASGDFTKKITVGGIITRVIQGIENNGAPALLFATANDPTSNNFNNLTVQYAGSMSPEIVDFRIWLSDVRRSYGMDFPQGCLVWDFGLGAGTVENPFDGRDTYNTQALTEFALKFNTTLTPTAGKVFTLRQELQPRTL